MKLTPKEAEAFKCLQESVKTAKLSGAITVSFDFNHAYNHVKAFILANQKNIIDYEAEWNYNCVDSKIKFKIHLI